MVRFGQWKTPRGSSGSAHSALAAARALAGVVTVTWLGKATCSCGTRITWLRKISRPVTVAVCWHSAAWVAAALGLTEGDGEGDDDAGDDDALGEAAVAAPVDDAEMLPQPASTIAARAAAHGHTRAQAALLSPAPAPLGPASQAPAALPPTALRLVASGRSMPLGRVCPHRRFHLALRSVLRFDRYARFDRETSAPLTAGAHTPAACMPRSSCFSSVSSLIRPTRSSRTGPPSPGSPRRSPAAAAAAARAFEDSPGTGALPLLCGRPEPPRGCAVSASSLASPSRMSAIRLRSGCGSIPRSVLYATCLARRRSVSSIARCIDGVTLSAYMCTWPETLRAARPIVWISDVPDRKKPSLSASRIDTSDTSGRSRPSRSRLIPTSTSYSPSRSSRSSSTRRSVSTSLCRYLALMPSSSR